MCDRGLLRGVGSPRRQALCEVDGQLLGGLRFAPHPRSSARHGHTQGLSAYRGANYDGPTRAPIEILARPSCHAHQKAWRCSFRSLSPILSVVAHCAIAILHVGACRLRRRDHRSHCSVRQSVMRHFLSGELGPPSLPRRVLARSAGRTLVPRSGATHRLAAAHRPAFARAVDLAVIALGANADLSIAARAAESPTFFDHPVPGPVTTFWTRGRVPSDGPQRNIASITAMTRKARGYEPRAFALSAARAAYTTTPTAPKKRTPPTAPPLSRAARPGSGDLRKIGTPGNQR
jgi:hypothetical protein